MSEQPDRHWHLEKSLNVGHLLTTFVIAASAFLWAGQMDKRVALVESAVEHQKQRDARQDEETMRMQQQVIDRLLTIEKKIDRFIDRELDRGARR